jgi:iron complex outermembrane receptor protein
MRAFWLASAATVLILGAPAWAQTTTDQNTTQSDQAASSAPPETQAATSNGSQIADIVVTAQRRAERAQDVPIAITALSGEQLASRGITNTLDIGNFVPNLVAQNNTGIGSANAYFLRGLGSTETIATFDPPVGTYVDDIYLSRQNANNLSLFDVDRVEVLRGPQGTLFGRNTTGGAINVIMKQPGDYFAGYAEVGYGRYNKVLGRASVDIPLAPTFAIKLSGYFQNDDGYVKNVTTGERLNDDDGWGARLGIRGELSDSVRWYASYAHIVADGENILNFTCNPANPTDCKGRFVTSGLAETDGPPSPYAPLVISGRKANFGMGQESTSDLITSHLQFDVAPDTTLALITGFVSLSQQYGLDFFDGRGGPTVSAPRPAVRGLSRGGFVIVNDGHHQQFTQEVKLNGKLANGFIDYVAGLYYIDERNKTDFADIFGISPTLSLLLADRILHNRTEAMAGYAQADFNVTDQLKLTAGIRYTDETKGIRLNDNRASCNDGSLEASCLDNANLIAGSGVRIPTKQTTKIWTPRFAVNFKPNDQVLLFASATRGFKSGGWNARASSPGTFLPFDPEKVWSYEAGIKSDWLDRRLRVNLTAFWLDVSDLQVLAGLLNPTNGSLTFLTRNFADYRNKGVEAEVTVVPVDNLNLYANLGYQNDHYRLPKNAPAFDPYGIQSVAGQLAACQAALAAGRIPGGPDTTACANGIVTANGTISTPVRTPRWSLALGGSYKAELGDSGWSVVPAVNATYHSKQEVAIANLSLYDQAVTGTNGTFPANPFGDGDFIIGSHSASAGLFNASIALNTPNDRWKFSVECSNCFNKEFIQTSLSNYSYLNAPMTWTARARYNF